MVHAKNYETACTFVKVMQRKLWPLFPDAVYNVRQLKVIPCKVLSQANAQDLSS